MCALCKLKNSGAWTIQMIGRPHSAASWGLMIPSMKEALKLTPEAKGAAIQINPEYVQLIHVTDFFHNMHTVMSCAVYCTAHCTPSHHLYNRLLIPPYMHACT